MRFFAVSILALSVAACATPQQPAPDNKPKKTFTTYKLSPAQINAVKSGVRGSLKDPGSAQFGDIAASTDNEGDVTVCGYVNAKNSYGGYTGSKPFFGSLLKGKAFVPLSIGGTNIEVQVTHTMCREYGVTL